MSEFRAGELVFELRLSPRRKSLEIAVDREGGLVLSAPPDAGEERLLAFVESKRLWIYKKLAEREKFGSPPSPKRYVEGEGFLYLGKSYRLKRLPSCDEPLVLMKGRFLLCSATATDPRSLFIAWYSERMKSRALRIVSEYGRRMGAQVSRVIVQDLGYRWGSCGKGQRLYFHWKTILLPARIVEYVVVHELAHLCEPHHTPEFWLRVERAMPDFERRKGWLLEHGTSVEEAV